MFVLLKSEIRKAENGRKVHVSASFLNSLVLT